MRALLGAGLTEKDIAAVLLQHGDGKTALIRGDVDAWAGLDPRMAQAEEGAKRFYREADANTWGNPQCARAVLERLSGRSSPRAHGLRGSRCSGISNEVC